ncbi:unnamed protein product [Vitrella brassicaformis CCMP3155]|uniref:Phospholipase A2 domain-containing protein n=2 Tax=Vitrella brassicaformis TaxID=1169539 RepID=A0A0G4FAY3_VITBC|nr:unnamed protein product [Vitrella brassicaformis CCMP3155]|mmetsp:Transcript_41959/g.104758  ORF Transcript_41959/g.104758 Transcript_41959/m.104758 type:complete len:148 (+) Transcript_41959:130-573(+)|eukprot:CEM10082.1 unnamed protein product [Vitrella brassicaformis CCMP3155]
MSGSSHIIVFLVVGLSVAAGGNHTSIRRLDPCDTLGAPCSSPYARVPNGCNGVPDTWGSVDFTEVCNEHDRCYYTLGSVADQCNDAFRAGLISECERAVTFGPLLFACKTAANGMYTAVAASADFYHARAQKRQELHECCCFDGTNC